MKNIQRLPAIPLITVDPYFSIWSCQDLPTGDDTRHWTGERKRLEVSVETDGREYRLLGNGSAPAAELTGCHVRPTVTEFEYRVEDNDIRLSFCTPLLLDDLEQMSTPVTLLKLETSPGHSVQAKVLLHDDICYNGLIHPEMTGRSVQENGLYLAAMGRQQQNILGHSGDHICIDWGYAWMASETQTAFSRQAGHYALELRGKAGQDPLWAVLAYDDVASICYFGVPTKAWYARNGRTIREAITNTWEQREALWSRCESFDRQLIRQAEDLGGEDYAELVCASYRQSISAHKLIAGEDGRPVFLSKENSSNGCIGTADVSYPSMPLFLLYNPELVRAMCRPILRFASCPVWPYEFAPHDVGRYPYACGQVYSLRHPEDSVCDPAGPSGVHFPYYLLPASAQVYDLHWQMPIEECGNMLLMLAAALNADGDLELIEEHLPVIEKWAVYLEKNGRDPGEQLCTDDFAGHLAQNVNLALKAACGLGAYGLMLERLGKAGEGAAWKEKARKMAEGICTQADRGNHTALTLDGPKESWSLKYNAVWDILLGLGLCEPQWYSRELEWYLSKTETYGVPLDSRKTYTKSDWMLWAAALSSDKSILERLCAPVARYLRETPSRVPFSDWYETTDGRYVGFIARSVQGGIFMPLLRRAWKSWA